MCHIACLLSSQCIVTILSKLAESWLSRHGVMFDAAMHACLAGQRLLLTLSLTMAFTFLEVWHCLDYLFFLPEIPPSLALGSEGEQVKAWLQWNKMMARVSNSTSPRTLKFGIKLSTWTLWNCVKIELKRIVKFSTFPTPGYRDISYYNTLGKMGADGDEAINGQVCSLLWHLVNTFGKGCLKFPSLF